MIDCILCKSYQDKAKIISENEVFYSLFDKNPVTPGHALVVPKQHLVNLLDLEEQQWELLGSALKTTVKMIESTNLKELYSTWIEGSPNDVSRPRWEAMLNHIGSTKKPDGYNFGNNEGEAAGRTVHHLHVHIIPRFFGDVTAPKGGIRQIIPGMGDYKD